MISSPWVGRTIAEDVFFKDIFNEDEVKTVLVRAQRAILNRHKTGNGSFRLAILISRVGAGDGSCFKGGFPWVILKSG
jgi:hypothetical protein